MITVETQNMVLSIDKWVEKAKGKTLQFTIEFIQDLNAAVVEATPVKTGFLRGSWFAAIGDAGLSPGGGAVDMSGGLAVSRMNLVAAGIVPGQVFHALNGAAYARFVEYGTATMAPRAFVRGTISQASAIAEATANRIAGAG